jgi:hypothetical protein
MAAILPFIASISRYRFATTIENRVYLLDVRWNSRAESWYFDMLSEDETPLRRGMRLVLGAFLGVRSASDELPHGVLMAIDRTGEGREAGFDDLGDRVVVFYFTRDEVSAA